MVGNLNLNGNGIAQSNQQPQDNYETDRNLISQRSGNKIIPENSSLIDDMSPSSIHDMKAKMASNRGRQTERLPSSAKPIFKAKTALSMDLDHIEAMKNFRAQERKKQNTTSASEGQNSFAQFDRETKLEQQKAEEDRKLCHRKFLFFPPALYMRVWEGITTFALVLACIMTPYGLAFDEKKDGAKNFFECTDGWTCTELTTDLIFIVEILVAFNTGVKDIKSNIYVTNRQKLALLYIKSWFLVDVIAVLPRFARIVQTSGSATAILGILKFARISRIVKLLRLIKFFKADKDKNSTTEGIKSK